MIAHRGEHILAPENTIRAGRLAIEEGATALEVDIRLTADEQIVLFHDKNLKHHFGQNKWVHRCSASYLKSLSFKKEQYKFVDSICTLDEFLEEFRGSVPLNLDAKTFMISPKLLGRKLVRLVSDMNMLDQVWISAFNPLFLNIIKSITPSLRTGYLFRNLFPIHRYIDGFIEADAWHPHLNVISDRFVEIAIEKGKELYVWTINDPVVAESFQKYHLQGIITDRLFREKE